MMRVFTAAASTTLVLGAMRLVAAPYDIATLGVASWLLYLGVRDCAGVGAARVSVALLAASLAPTLTASPDVAALSVSPLASLSLLWWAPLIVATVAVVGVGPELVRTGWFLLTWWAGCALLAIVAPAPWAALASCVETAPAAAMAGIAVARLAAVATGAARRRSVLIGTLTMTCVWQAWLVLGTGRPARLLVPMLAAALMVAAADLADDAADQRDGIGAAIVIAMVVLGLVPGAHTLVAQQQAAATVQAPAAFVPGADSPSSIAAP